MSQDFVSQSKDDQFHYYPVHFLMAVFADSERADQMLEELLRIGVPAHDLHAWRDAEGARAMDADGTFHGWTARVWRWAERATGEHQILTKYTEALQHGHVVVAIHCEPSLKQGFVSMLQDRQAHEIRYFSAGGIETIAAD